MSHSCTFFVIVFMRCGRQVAVAANADDHGGHRPSALGASPLRGSVERARVLRACSRYAASAALASHVSCIGRCSPDLHTTSRIFAPLFGKTQRTNQRTRASPSGDAVTSWGRPSWGLASPPPDPRRQRAGVPPQYQQVGHPLVLGCCGGYADQLHAGAERCRQSQRSRERPRESRIRRERIEELDRENAKLIDLSTDDAEVPRQRCPAARRRCSPSSLARAHRPSTPPDPGAA